MEEWLDWNLLAKYVFGECTEAEASRVQVWLETDPARKRLLFELKEQIDATKQPYPERDVDALWHRLEQHAQRRERQAEEERERSTERQPVPRTETRSRRLRPDRAARDHERPSGLRQAVRVAAPVLAVLCVVLVVVWGGEGAQPGTVEREAKVFATERGQRATIRLADGTLVRLNAASSITVSASFGTGPRTVRLEGEAYFDVARDTTRPFIVRTDRATTRVLGTAFNLSAYPEDSEVRLLVAEGSVAFEAAVPAHDANSDEAQDSDVVPSEDSETGRRMQGMVLTARETATLAASGRVVRGRADPERYLAWMEGDLYFDEASYREVVRTLERSYDIRVVTENGIEPSGHLNARFLERESLGEVLDVIATTFDLHYEWTEKTVRFFAAPPHSS